MRESAEHVARRQAVATACLVRLAAVALIVSGFALGALGAAADSPAGTTPTNTADNLLLPALSEAKTNVTPEQTAEISRLINQLGSAAWQERQEAEKRLRAIGAPAVTALRAAAKQSDDPEVLSRVKLLLGELDTEYWEGYYYASVGRWEDVVASGIPRVRFWFAVRRQTDGSFTAESDEEDRALGAATIEGKLTQPSGKITFRKRYKNSNPGRGAPAEWLYVGKWVPERGRIEGTYGPNMGGFILYFHKLSEEERKTLEIPAE